MHQWQHGRTVASEGSRQPGVETLACHDDSIAPAFNTTFTSLLSLWHVESSYNRFEHSNWKTMTADNTLQVLEYLSKKGYSKSEAMLRTESAARDVEGKPLSTSTEEPLSFRYSKVFSKSCQSEFTMLEAKKSSRDIMRTWIEDNLDIYKVFQPARLSLLELMLFRLTRGGCNGRSMYTHSSKL